MTNALTTTEDTVFEAKIRRNTEFKRLIRILDQLADETPVSIDSAGIEFCTADPSMVGLMDIVLKPNGFSNYQPPETDLEFKLDVGELKEKVTEAKKSDDLELSVTREPDRGSQKPRLHVTVRSAGVESTFSLNTSEVDEEDQPETGNLEFSGSGVVATEELSRAIDRLNDSVVLTLTEDRLELESNGDQGDTKVAFPEKSDQLHAVKLDTGRVQSLYSTDYLNNIKQLKQVAKRADIRFDDDYPLQITASNNWFDFKYVVAPRIEE